VKSVKPDGKVVCATCKRRVQPAELQKGRKVCADRAACREATTAWLSKEQFVEGMARA